MFITTQVAAVSRVSEAREIPRSTRAADRFYVFFSRKSLQYLGWARAAHLLQCLGRLILPSSERRFNEYQRHG